MSDKLRECPFCGNEIILIINPMYNNKYKVGCEKDCFSMPARPDVWFTSEKVAYEAANHHQEPKHETVEQWEKRKGEPYPDDGPVWYMVEYSESVTVFELHEYEMFNDWQKYRDRIFVANHHGKPEETK